MKIKCDFCKTEYTLDRMPGQTVKCAVCGHMWAPSVPVRRNAFFTFIAALCALMSAIVFAVAVIARHNVNKTDLRPLVAIVTDVATVTDDNGVAHLVVSGEIINQTAEIYGAPDLTIISRDAMGNEISRQKFMPSATLLDAGGRATFTHTLSAPAAGVKKLSVELDGVGDK